MKLLRVLFAALMVMMVSGATAQTVYNSNGSSCGKVDSNGTVRNGNGSSIGKVESDGTVRNGNGSSIGKVSGVPKEWAAAYFFFFF